MGITIDLGDNSSSSTPRTGAALEPGTYQATLKKVVAGTNKDETKVYVQAVFSNIEDGEDVEGKEFGNRNAYSQKFWLVGNAVGFLRRFAAGAGVDLPQGTVDFDNLDELSSVFYDAFTETIDAFEITVEVDKNRMDYLNGRRNEGDPEVPVATYVASIS